MIFWAGESSDRVRLRLDRVRPSPDRVRPSPDRGSKTAKKHCFHRRKSPETEKNIIFIEKTARTLNETSKNIVFIEKKTRVPAHRAKRDQYGLRTRGPPTKGEPCAPHFSGKKHIKSQIQNLTRMGGHTRLPRLDGRARPPPVRVTFLIFLLFYNQ